MVNPIIEETGPNVQCFIMFIDNTRSINVLALIECAIIDRVYSTMQSYFGGHASEPPIRLAEFSTRANA